MLTNVTTEHYRLAPNSLSLWRESASGKIGRRYDQSHTEEWMKWTQIRKEVKKRSRCCLLVEILFCRLCTVLPTVMPKDVLFDLTVMPNEVLFEPIVMPNKSTLHPTVMPKAFLSFLSPWEFLTRERSNARIAHRVNCYVGRVRSSRNSLSQNGPFRFDRHQYLVNLLKMLKATLKTRANKVLIKAITTIWTVIPHLSMFGKLRLSSTILSQG